VRVLVIGNPAAGAGRAGRRAAALVRALEARGHAVDWRLTRAPGDARRLAAAGEGRADCIVAAGGDGTLNEVLNGLAEPSATPLAPMPLGTANMLARALGVPRDPEALARAVEGGARRRIDLCRADGTRFLAVAGVGFDALVTERVGARRHGRLGYRGYAVPILAALARYRPPRLSVRLDGGAPVAGGFLIASKLPNYGGVLRVAPAARLDAGRFEACLLREARVPDLLRAVVPAFRGRLAALRNVAFAEATHIRVDSESPAPVQLDGDYWGTTPVSFEVEPGVVPVVVPAAAAEPVAVAPDAWLASHGAPSG
jgi:YegS/Rv2252/BmrU family lipid kinase